MLTLTSSRRVVRWLAPTVLALALGLLVAACGADGNSAESTTAEAAPAAPEPKQESGLDELYKGVFTAPPDSGPAAPAGKRIWVMPCASFVSSCNAPAKAAVEAAKAAKWDATFFDPRFDPSKFAEGIRQAIASRADGIVMVGIDCDATKQPLTEARKAGVEVVALYGLDCDDPNVGGKPMFSADIQYGQNWPNYASFVKALGAAKARYLIETMKKDIKVIGSKQDDALSLKYMREGFEEELRKCGSCEVVANIEVSATDIGNPTILRQKTSSLLQQYPEANAVHYLYDSLAVSGPAAAVVESGRDLVAIGGEGEKPNIDLIRNGKGQTAGIAFPIEWAGWAAVDTLNRVLAGEDPVPEGLGFQAVDKENNLPAPGQAWEPDVNYKDAYLRVWSGG